MPGERISVEAPAVVPHTETHNNNYTYTQSTHTLYTHMLFIPVHL